MVGGAGTACAAWPFASAWQPSERARAIGAPVEVDVGKLEPGARLTVKWRGKPVWIVRRTKETLESLPGLDAVVRDPASDEPQAAPSTRATPTAPSSPSCSCWSGCAPTSAARRPT